MNEKKNKLDIPISYKIRLVDQLFIGRRDVVPLYHTSKNGKNHWYSPMCYNDGRRDICKKSCRNCTNADYISLSDSHILEHFRGKFIIGIYPLLPDNTCHFVAADFDDHRGDKDPHADILEFNEVCAEHELAVYLLRSKSGTGYHAYFYSNAPVPAWKFRAVILVLLEEAGLIKDGFSCSSFDRIFPNQNKLSGKGFGNLIALPFQGEAGKMGHTLFLDPQSNFRNPFANQWDVISTIDRISEAKLDELVDQWNLDEDSFSMPVCTSEQSDAMTERLMECGFFQWCNDNPNDVPEPLWYAMISNAASVRPGGRSFCHELSKGYKNYSKSETDAKILHALDSSAPHTCRYIIENGYKCSKSCSVKSPAGLAIKQNASPENHTKVRPQNKE
jgi:hypothetical protein